MGPRFPARLHVLLARDRPIGLILRKGPAKSVCTILWNRANDTFELGQWMRGRIYERRCDLSPDGKYFIYFAMNGKWGSRTKGSWTAVSRAPWLKAIVLLGKGDCWHGGGLFTSRNSYCVNDGYGHFVLEDTSEVRRDDNYRFDRQFGGECLSVYYPKLMRDGWSLRDRLKAGRLNSMAIFEKPLPQGWILRKYAHEEVGAPPGKGCYWDEHELEHSETHQRTTFPKWEWADLDGRDLIWAEDGQLKRARVRRAGLDEPVTLADFNAMRFEARAAPY